MKQTRFKKENDKWGNEMKLKYPRTFHLPYSEKPSSDDKRLDDDSIFDGEVVSVTLKYDGENTTLTSEDYWARSLNCSDRVYRHWIKNFHANIAQDIPKNWRICGENLYAKHSCYYNNLKSYFYGFNIWDGEKCLSWKDTLEYFKMLNIIPVEEIYNGIYNKSKILEVWKNYSPSNEGFVIRKVKEFEYKDFSFNVAKFVGKDFILPDDHWIHQEIQTNKLI